MAKDKPQGCVQPAEGPILKKPQQTEAPAGQAAKEVRAMQVMVGKEAPDFGASAFTKGGFANIRLSDYKGKWVFLCFYLGDFTFV